MSASQSSHRERGATLVEYALIVALIMVVSLGVISFVQDAGSDELSDSDQRIGTQADDAYYPGSVTPSSVPATTSTTQGAIGVHLASNPTITVADESGNRWRVTVTFTLLDSGGNGVIGATMNGSWVDLGQGSQPVGTCTTSTSAGTCTIQYTRIRDQYTTVNYTLTSITGGTFSWTPSSAGEGSITVTCSSPIC